jgi:uncharacterized membrane protein YdjX (TVP38/TMEM64 family)
MSPEPDAQDPRRALLPAKLAAAALGLAACLLVGQLVRGRLGVAWNADSIRMLVDATGFWGPVAFVTLVALRMFVMVPGALVLTAAGALFGAAEGTLYGALGLTLTAGLAFGTIRAVGAESLRARVPARFQPLLDLGRSRSGIALLTFLSGYPIGPSVWAQTGAAVSGMALVPFVLAVGVGSAVRAATYSLFGSALVAGEGVWTSAALLVAAFGLPLLHPRVRAVIHGVIATSRRGGFEAPTRPGPAA